MGVLDFVSSFWFFLSSWPMPADTPNVVYAVGKLPHRVSQLHRNFDSYHLTMAPTLPPLSQGNTGSCTAQGFFVQLSLAVPFYNAMLALNYLLSIRYAVRFFFASKLFALP